MALILSVVCEILAGLDGLGHWVLLSARSFRSADLFAGVILLGVIGYLTALRCLLSRSGSCGGDRAAIEFPASSISRNRSGRRSSRSPARRFRRRRLLLEIHISNKHGFRRQYELGFAMNDRFAPAVIRALTGVAA